MRGEDEVDVMTAAEAATVGDGDGVVADAVVVNVMVAAAASN